MIQMEIDIKNKTIKLKEGIKLTDLQKMLQETLIDWQNYTILPETKPLFQYGYREKKEVNPIINPYKPGYTNNPFTT